MRLRLFGSNVIYFNDFLRRSEVLSLWAFLGLLQFRFVLLRHRDLGLNKTLLWHCCCSSFHYVVFVFSSNVPPCQFETSLSSYSRVADTYQLHATRLYDYGTRYVLSSSRAYTKSIYVYYKKAVLKTFALISK